MSQLKGDKYFAEILTSVFFEQTREMYEDLKGRTGDVYKEIVRFIKQNKYSPTFQEIADRTGLSIQGVSNKVKELEEKGYIYQLDTRYRRIRLSHEDYQIRLDNMEELKKQLETLKQMKEQNLLTEEEYNAKKRLILGI